MFWICKETDQVDWIFCLRFYSESVSSLNETIKAFSVENSVEMSVGNYLWIIFIVFIANRQKENQRNWVGRRTESVAS